jgi:hypothetical protein
VMVDASAGVAVSSARARTEPTIVASFFMASSVGEIKRRDNRANVGSPGGSVNRRNRALFLTWVEVCGARPSWCTTP